MTIPKFRAWHKRLNLMINHENIRNIDFFEKCITYYDPKKDKPSADDLHWGLFEDIELMQCIGKDEEGNDVFEGDILNVFGGHLMQGWQDFSQITDGEVIGNCFEHPELLEK